jgi:hypothetical protein
MNFRRNNILIQSVGELATALQGTEPDDKQWQAIEERVTENELQDNESTPHWLLELLTFVRDRKSTEGWVDFPSDGLDDSNSFNLIRELDQVLPMRYENNEESWMLTFPEINMEACISFEGSCYKVSEIDGTWVLGEDYFEE